MQLILIYAVGPGKSAMSRGEKDGLSAVTGQFLHQLRCCSNETFPKGIALWVKHHPTAEIVEKAKFEIGLITNAVLLSDNTKQKKKFENWSPSEVAEWLSKLNLSKDYSAFITHNHITGSSLLAAKELNCWNLVGLTVSGDIVTIIGAIQ